MFLVFGKFSVFLNVLGEFCVSAVFLVFGELCVSALLLVFGEFCVSAVFPVLCLANICT